MKKRKTTQYIELLDYSEPIMSLAHSYKAELHIS